MANAPFAFLALGNRAHRTLPVAKRRPLFPAHARLSWRVTMQTACRHPLTALGETSMLLVRWAIFAAGLMPAVALAQQQGSTWASLPRMQLERQFGGPLQDTIIRVWRDPVDGATCYLYLPNLAQHSPPGQGGFVQYGANTIGSISCFQSVSAAARQAASPNQPSNDRAARSKPAPTNAARSANTPPFNSPAYFPPAAPPRGLGFPN